MEFAIAKSGHRKIGMEQLFQRLFIGMNFWKGQQQPEEPVSNR